MSVDRALIARFWEKTIQRGSCVLWIGAQKIGRNGISRSYGLFGGGEYDGSKRRMVQAHRFIYEQCIEPLGARILMHSCDTPACVALQHLSPGTQAQNVADCVAKNRARKPVFKVRCAKGHLLDESNTYKRPSGRQECKTCREEQRAVYRNKSNV